MCRVWRMRSHRPKAGRLERRRRFAKGGIHASPAGMAIRPWFASSSPLLALLFSHGGHNSQLMSEWPTAGRNARQACMLVKQRATVALHCTCANDGLIKLNKFISWFTDEFCNLFFY